MNVDTQIREALSLFDNLPRFPDGRIDYRTANTALVLTCFVTHGDELLLLKRSDKVAAYQGKWNAVAGYIDEPKPFVDKVMEEVREELGIDHAYIDEFRVGIPHKIDDEELQKTWIIVPARIELSEKTKIKLDWEHTESKWIKQAELGAYDVVPGLQVSFEAVR